jgi:ribonuclease VapC
MFVDASAILAILLREQGWEQHHKKIRRTRSEGAMTSVVAAWEAIVGLHRKLRLGMADAESKVFYFLDGMNIRIIGIEASELKAALEAFDRYGRHRYPETERNRGLNLADCFHYACAKSRGVAILHKDPGFDLTDLPRLDASAAG